MDLGSGPGDRCCPTASQQARLHWHDCKNAQWLSSHVVRCWVKARNERNRLEVCMTAPEMMREAHCIVLRGICGEGGPLVVNQHRADDLGLRTQRREGWHCACKCAAVRLRWTLSPCAIRTNGAQLQSPPPSHSSNIKIGPIGFNSLSISLFQHATHTWVMPLQAPPPLYRSHKRWPKLVRSSVNMAFR